MTLLAALLQAILARQPAPVQRARPFELLSVGAVATAEEARSHVDDVLAVVAPVRLSVLTDNACDGEGHCMPHGAHLVAPEDIFASMLQLKIRWDEAFDAAVIRLQGGIATDLQHLGKLARYVHGLLRAGGLLVIAHQDGAEGGRQALPWKEWLAPWFAGTSSAGGIAWAGERRRPRPAAEVFPAGRLRSIQPLGSLNCTAQCFAALSRRHLAELRSLGQARLRLRERCKAEPLDGHGLALHFVLAVGRSLRSLEDAATGAAASCRAPMPPALELALAQTFESLSRATRRLDKLRFRLWTKHSPEGGRVSESARYAKTVLWFVGTAITDALRPVVELQALVAEAAGEAAGGVPSLEESARERERRSSSSSWLFWEPKGDGGEMALTEIIYRRVFDAQQLDQGLLPVLLAEVFARGDSVADFGASLGEYATFFNRTGLVTALAFDGTEGIEAITKGVVLEVKLDQPFTLWRAFDWVLCLEVLEHIPKEFEQAALANLRRHARKGAIISWGNEWSTFTDAGHVNGQNEEYVQGALQSVGFQRDEALTQLLRASSRLWWVAETIAAYRVDGA